MTGNPAGVDRLGLKIVARGERWRFGCLLIWLVQPGIEYLNDLAACLDGVRDVDDIAEERGDTHADACLAVSGRSVNKSGSAGLHRGEQLAQVFLRHHQAGESVLQGSTGKRLVGNGLLSDLSLEGGQRYGRRTEILAKRLCFGRRGQSAVCQGVSDLA